RSPASALVLDARMPFLVSKLSGAALGTLDGCGSEAHGSLMLAVQASGDEVPGGTANSQESQGDQAQQPPLSRGTAHQHQNRRRQQTANACAKCRASCLPGWAVTLIAHCADFQGDVHS